MQKLPAGIYFESTPAFHEMTGQQHAYLVYRDGKGGERVIRGGPGGLPPTFGTIEVQADIPLRESKDAYGKEDTPSNRKAKRIDIGDRDPETLWNEMVKKAKEIGEAGINYDLFNLDGDRTDGERSILTSEYWGQNSNSVIRAVLESAKINIKKIISEDEFLNKFHGIENDLSKPAGGFNPKKPRERISLPSSEPDEEGRIPDDRPDGRLELPDSSVEDPGKPKNNFLDDTINHTPAAKKIERAALGGQETVAEILSKPPEQLTEPEINRLTRVKGAMLSNDPNRAKAENAVTEAHRRAFTDGREGDRPFPTDIAPALTPAGQPVADGVKQVIDTFIGNAGNDAMPARVSTLQSSLNRVERDDIPLKVDGVFGDKTRGRLRETVARKGPEPILDDFGGGDGDFDIFDDDDDAVFA
tara:strand:- start:90485 stop:91729 length:1245 start_codon:yes stop_codon:yes gene_type:complete